MELHRLTALLEGLQAGRTSMDEALKALKDLPYEDLGHARVDHHRSLRCGYPEVIYCPGKTPGQIADIFGKLMAQHDRVLATRCDADVAQEVQSELSGLRYHPLPRLLTAGYPFEGETTGSVAVFAGMSDTPEAPRHAQPAWSTAAVAPGMFCAFVAASRTA